MLIINITSFMDLKMAIENIEQIYSDAQELSVGLTIVDNFFKDTAPQAEFLFNKHFHDKFMTMTVNIGGHSKGKYDKKTTSEINEMPYEQHFVERLKKIFIYSLSVLIRDILENKNTKERILDSFEFNLEFPVSNPSNYCFSCGCTTQIYFNGNEFNMYSKHMENDNKPSQNKCKFPKGVGVDTLHMHFNSGKIVVANDLRSLFKGDIDEDDYITKKSGYYNSINSDYGVQLNSRYWAEKGLVYLQVGNSSPRIFVKKDGVITFKSEYTYNRKTDKETKNYTSDETLKGYVCTDLWAVCAIDYDLFISLCKEQEIAPEKFLKERDCTVLDSLPKGIYKIIDNTSIKTRNKQKMPYGSMEYTTIESRSKDLKFKGLETVYPLQVE